MHLDHWCTLVCLIVWRKQKLANQWKWKKNAEHNVYYKILNNENNIKMCQHVLLQYKELQIHSLIQLQFYCWIRDRLIYCILLSALKKIFFMRIDIWDSWIESDFKIWNVPFHNIQTIVMMKFVAETITKKNS